MPLLFMRYFQLSGPICWMWTLSLIATEVCVCYICSFYVYLAQKAARYLVNLNSWEFFFPSPQLFRRPCPLTDTSITQPSYRGLAKSNGGVIVCTNWAELSILEKIMPSPQYFTTCSAVVGRVIQPRACLVLSGGCRLYFLPYSPCFRPTRSDYIQFNHP